MKFGGDSLTVGSFGLQISSSAELLILNFAANKIFPPSFADNEEQN